MSIFNAAKCFLGFHDWSEWSWDQCVGTRHCQRNECHGKQVTTQHQWTEWIDSEQGFCSQWRRCFQCESKEQRPHHLWGPWGRESSESAIPVRFCQKCPDGKEEMDPYVILWVPNNDLSNCVLAHAQMGILAPSTKNVQALQRSAWQIDSGLRDRIETGYIPSTVDSNYNYLAWEWDDEREQYHVVTWKIDHWE